jgi:hypothetical protein
VSTNTAVGAGALSGSNTGANNTIIGFDALKANTTGAGNTVIGSGSLSANTTGGSNTTTGFNTLLSNTTGANNTAVGRSALQSNTTGDSNIALGRDALVSNTTASNNVAVGHQAGFSNTTGASNTVIGVGAGYSLTTGLGNTFVGNAGFVDRGPGGLVTTGSKNTILGGYNGNQGGLDIRTASNRIVLSDGDGNPRQIIDNNGSMQFGTTTAVGADITGAGMWYSATAGFLYVGSTSGNPVAAFNRNTSDGDIVELKQAATIEGTISVSGTTVSYNGGNLSRWAQLTTPKDDTPLFKGTVMSNLDEMNVYIAPTTYWTEEDELPEGVNVNDVKVETHEVQNEQLNKVKVSDVEGDANVAGVFVNWTYDKAHQVDEINMAMTGDMIIRIAQGVTVQRGDLLMSAGDGTAKPQGDDIVRSKTIAKVTSTHVTCTYADGSFCVPCVLMAC